VSAQAQTPLLSTKLHAPARASGSAAKRSSRAFPARQTAKLALIRAPGRGKSTLPSQWRVAEQGRQQFACLTIDSSHSDPTRFWTYAFEALRAVDPVVGPSSLGLLRASGVDLVSEMLPVLVEELSQIQTRLVLALYDYHQLEGDAVHATVRRLLDDPPERVCIAIATRTEPPLQVARLRPRGQLVEVNADELRFSLDETRSFLDGVLGLELSKARTSLACTSASRDGRPQSIWPRCRFAAARIGTSSSRGSPAMSATSSTTWARRSWRDLSPPFVTCCCGPRSSSA
jgi:LuxR family maltose regulon positive regulatory protein